MIRFIDLKDQITCDGTHEFAWYDTVTDTFETHNYSQAWETWEEFEDDFHGDESYVYIEGIHDIERYRRLFPKGWPNMRRWESD